MAEWMPEWRFARMTDAQINENPVQGEFFTSESDLPERLVREAIQNSMDARIDDQTVRIRFAFSGDAEALSAERAARYLDGLYPHFNAVAEGHSSQPATGHRTLEEEEAIGDAVQLLYGEMPYLVVEDFGTTGLTGDLEQNSDREERNNFWGFFRSVGIAVKGSDAGGSWGLGKWVFPDASRVNSFISVTHRQGEDRHLVMGMSVLKTHMVGQNKYPPYGHFADASELDDFEWLQMPVDSTETPNFVNTAIDDFKLRRRDGTGLSTIIPWPWDELDAAGIARAVLTQYFVPIVRGDLVVEITDRDGEVRVIDNDSIDDHVRSIAPSVRDDESPASLLSAVHLARWSTTLEHDAHEEGVWVPSRSYNPLDEEHGALNVEQIRQRFNQGERLAFALYTEVRRKTESEDAGAWFYVYLERDDALAQGHDYFVRGHLRIPKMDHIQRFQARALVLVEPDSALGPLLQDAEGPAHARWADRARRVTENWAAGASARVEEVRRAPLRLLERLVQRPQELQYDALADLFPADPKSLATPTPSAQHGDRVRGTTITVPRKPDPLRISQLEGGFRVSAAKGSPPPIGSVWRAKFAYDIRGSSQRAFRQYERGLADGAADFSLNDAALSVEVNGCRTEIAADNELRLIVEKPVFNVTVLGFDDRDIVVQTIPAPVDDEEGDDAP